MIVGKKRRELTFGERLQRTMDKHNRRQQKEMALFRKLQKEQGVAPDQPISIMAMLKKKG